MSYKKESISSYQILPPPPETITQSQSKPQKPSYLPITSKLSVVIYRKRLYIKSIIDRYQYLRMFIFGIMMTAYTQQKHRDLIDIIKRIIEGGIGQYDNSTKLSKLIKKIDSISEDKGVDTQNAIIELFTQSNDSLIINSFIEFMENQGSQYFRLQECKAWFQGQFRQKIRILDTYSSNKSDITFFRDGDTLIYQSQNDIENIQGMSLSSNLLTKSQLTNTQFRTDSHQRDNQILELSIMKPSLHNVSESNGSPLMRHKNSTDSKYSPKPSAFDIEDDNKQKKDKQKGFDIWDYFCC